MVLSVLNGMMNAGGEYEDNLYLTAKVKVVQIRLKTEKSTLELLIIFVLPFQDLLFDGVKSGVVALIVQLIALFGAVIPNIEDLVPLPIALQGL